MLSKPTSHNFGKWLIVVAATTIAAIAVLPVFQSQGIQVPDAGLLDDPVPLPADELLTASKSALAANDLMAAETLANQYLAATPDSASALLLAAEAATKLNRPNDALDYYARIPDDGSKDALIGLIASGSLLMRAGQLSAALDRFERAVAIDPHNFEARSRLAYLLNTGGRRWESMPHLLALIKQKNFTIEQLLLLGNLDEVINQRELLETCRKIEPDDPIPTLGLARIHLAQGRTDQAKDLAIQLFEFNPLDINARVILGQLLIDAAADAKAFLDWHDDLPLTADEHPDIWFIRGAWAQQRGELAEAVRCFGEALDRNPNHQRATYRTAQTLQKLGRSEAKFFHNRAAELERLADMLHPIYSIGPEQRRMVEVARQMESLGRLWEAWAWYHAALAHFPHETSLRQERSRLEEELSSSLPQVVAAQHPTAHLDFQTFALPVWKDVSQSLPDAERLVRVEQPVSFTDQSSVAGLDFQYICGDDLTVPGIPIYLNLCGGIAVLDFDGDAWPDVYLSQGSNWPPATSMPKYSDRLFRNMGNGRFQDVTAAAGLGDTDYSQGVSIGDVDNDGFPDLYVANIGQNRLYRNRGDGTFEDVTEYARITGSHWTASCLIADLNGDSLPELYDVNYLRGPGPFETVCKDGTEIRTCTPAHFNAEDDRLFINLGAGRFEDQSAAAGVLVPDGKGLGVLAADFQGDGLLDLFVANDTTANFYFENQTKGRGQLISLVDQALVQGLALDSEGRSQACMGVAAGDANADGLLDLFVTNFYNESNTLYEQQTEGIFIDKTRNSGLREPSFPMLGFGTQFLDGELDGFPDLVIANGHIDDWTYKNIPFKMRPQYYRNLSGERFIEVRDPSLGEYFDGEYLGRCLARIDWNRDGAEDFIVMHLDVPVSLMTNESRVRGNFLKLSFVGIASDRDAIGTTVTVKCDGKTLVRQLTAGDGFQASNERNLIFGLGGSQLVDELLVRWPSGLQQTFAQIPVNQELLLQEGRAELVPRTQNTSFSDSGRYLLD